jgi:hypothetical protein
LTHDNPLEQHRALGDDAEAIEGGEPLVSVAMSRVFLPRWRRRVVRHRGAGHQVDEQFGCRGVEAGEGTQSPGLGLGARPEGPKRLMAFGDATI